MRGKLFSKIFLGFWLVSVAVLGSWMALHEYFDSHPQAGPRLVEKPEGPPPRLIMGLIYNLQNAPQEQLPGIVDDTREKHGIELYILRRSGLDLLEREVPAPVAQVAAKVRGSTRRAFDRWRGRPVVVHAIYRQEQGRLRVVMVFPEKRHGVLGLLDKLWLRIALAIIVSGIACYGLSRLLTRRLGALQQASRRLARGDLDARIRVREEGGDETDELARDFNSMAGQLKQRMESQKQLLRDVSHELRSPLARLRVALALARENPGQGDDYLGRIEQETARLEALISELLSSQQDSRQLDQPIDLVELLRGLCEDASFEGEVTGKTAVLRTERAQAPIASTGDLLHSVFDNIIRNALRHTEPGSQVDVILEARDGTYVITVEDRGPGVPEDQLEQIFEAFHRVDSARSREHGGHGLGLAIARRGIQIHGGTVRAMNTGSGLRVIVSLPVRR